MDFSYPSHLVFLPFAAFFAFVFQPMQAFWPLFSFFSVKQGILLKFLRLFCAGLQSLPSRGAWIEIAGRAHNIRRAFGRSPHGERGLKLLFTIIVTVKGRRSPHGERGLKWATLLKQGCHLQRRSPHGERGLKLHSPAHPREQWRRSPHGERGLKLTETGGLDKMNTVAPLTGSVD